MRPGIIQRLSVLVDPWCDERPARTLREHGALRLGVHDPTGQVLRVPAYRSTRSGFEPETAAWTSSSC